MMSDKYIHYLIVGLGISAVIGFFACDASYGQGSAGVANIQGESYLDGFDVKSIFGIEDITFEEEEAISYLDDIAKELSYLDEEFIASGVIDGVYSSLNECIQSAMQRHMPITIARDKVSLAKRRLVRAVRELFPSLNLYYEHNKGFKLYKADPDPTDDVDDSRNFRSEKWRVSLAQPLFRGGALWNQVKLEKAQLGVANAEYKKVHFDLMMEIARSYFNLARAKTVYAIKKDMQATLQGLLTISEEKQEAGLISDIEHLNVQSQQAQIEHDVEAAREEYELNALDFKKIMHVGIDEFADVVSYDDVFIAHVKTMVAGGDRQASDEAEQEKKLNELVKMAYENRPEFMIQKRKLEVNEWQEKIANGGWLPYVNLVTQFGQKAEQYVGVDNNPPWDEEHRIGIEVRWNFGGNTTFYSYDKNRQGTGVEATDVNIAMDGYYDRKNQGGFSIMDGLEQYAVTKDAEVKRKEAILELELAEKDIVSEVKEAYYNYNRSLIQLKAVFKRLEYRKKMVELAAHRSEINEIQISEYIQSEIDYVREQEGLYKTVVDYYLARVALDKAIGMKSYLSLEDL